MMIVVKTARLNNNESEIHIRDLDGETKSVMPGNPRDAMRLYLSALKSDIQIVSIYEHRNPGNPKEVIAWLRKNTF